MAATGKAALEKAIHDGKKGAWEVYADWLQAQGDLKGELAALVLKKPGLLGWWLKPRRPALFGELAMLLDDDTIEVRDWHPGFVKTLSVRPKAANGDDLGVLLTELLAAPICAFVEALIIHESARKWAAGLEPLLSSNQAKRLNRLELHSTGDEGGDISRILPRLPRLEHLTVIGDEIVMAKKDLDLANLKSLRLATDRLTDRPAVLSKAKLPKLESLELAVRYDAGELAPMKCLSKLLGTGTLRELMLSGLTFDETRLEQLFDCEGLARLRSLDLDGCLIPHDAEEMLREYVPLLRRIARVQAPRVGDADDNEEVFLDLR